MSTLSLIKTPTVTFPAFNRSIQGEQVVGITLPQASSILEHDYRISGNEIEEQIIVDDDVRDRIADFFLRCRSAEPDNRPYHDCYSLIWYALGKIKTLEKYDIFRSARMGIVNKDLLKAGTAYVIEAAQGTPNHSLLGVDGSDRSLNVLGKNSALAICSSEQLLRFYGGVAVRQILPLSRTTPYYVTLAVISFTVAPKV